MTDRSAIARQAALTLHSRVDGTKHTAPARAAFMARFEAEVDPDGTLPVAERRRRAERAKTAYFIALSRKAAKARRSTPAQPASSSNGFDRPGTAGETGRGGVGESVTTVGAGGSPAPSSEKKSTPARGRQGRPVPAAVPAEKAG